MHNVDIGCCISWCSSLGKLWDARCPTLDSLQVHTVEQDENGSKVGTCISLVSTSMTQERTYIGATIAAGLFVQQPSTFILVAKRQNHLSGHAAKIIVGNFA